MGRHFLQFHHVTFRYESAAAPLFHDISFQIPPGWSGVVGANGTGKTTLLQLAVGALSPDQGSIQRPRQHVVYCAQRTDTMPEQFREFLASSSKASNVLQGQLHIAQNWADRWQTLSHGERKRVQLAVALWLSPDVLAIDEPTNHVDAQAREFIIAALRLYQGVGLLVSHDRELLDALCSQCLFLELSKVSVRPGGVSQGLRTIRHEHQTLQKHQAQKRQEYKKLRQEMRRRRDLASQAQRRRSKRGLAPGDHDAREKKDRARITGKDAVGGKLQRQMQGRLTQTQQQAQAIRLPKEYTLGIWLPGARSKRDYLLHLSPGSLPLGEQKRLTYPELSIKPDDRIALTGPNGTGKSTFIQQLVRSWSMPEEQLTYVPQEISRDHGRQILAQARALPHEQLGYLMTIVSRLGSRPHRLLESDEPSPGETRKLLLALGMTRIPHLIILDEPTNHMDLPSIECLEQALSTCPCALVLVSHDLRFLRRLARQWWTITAPETVCALHRQL